MKHTGLGCQWMLEFRWLCLCLQGCGCRNAEGSAAWRGTRRSADSPVPALMMNHSNHICDHAPLFISFVMRPPYATRLRAQWPVSPGRRQGVQLGVRAQAAVLPAEDNELLTRRTPWPPADDASRHPRGPQPRHCLSSRWLGTQVSPAETDCPLVPGLLHSDTCHMQVTRVPWMCFKHACARSGPKMHMSKHVAGAARTC